jgi:hexosaminidase
MQEYLLLPKLLGLAERAWSKDPDWATEKNNDKSQQMYNEAWSVFTNISGKRELPRLDYFQNGYNYRIPTPGAIVQNGTVFSNFQFPGFVLRYTTDGTEPDLNSKIYSGPITEKSIIKLSAFSAKGRKGRSITMHNE